MVKGRQTAKIEQQKLKEHEKRILTSYFETIRIPSEIKVLPNNLVFSNLVKLIKKVSVFSCSSTSKKFQSIHFFFAFIKLIFFKKPFFSSLAFITRFKLSVGLV